MGKESLKVLGATNLAVDKDRSALDYYGTDPKSTRSLLENEEFCGAVWEPCVGHHLLSDVLKEKYLVLESDIAHYDGYEHEIIDFLTEDKDWDGDIVTNPPYNLSTEFAVRALDILKPGRKLALFLRLQWLEGISRYEKIFKNNPPKTVYVFANRQVSSKVDDFSGGSAVAFAWFVWEKGFTGNTEIKWIRND